MTNKNQANSLNNKSKKAKLSEALRENLKRRKLIQKKKQMKSET